jgi:hypothetical protein
MVMLEAFLRGSVERAIAYLAEENKSDVLERVIGCRGRSENSMECDMLIC